MLGRRFQNVTESREISVETATDILDVVNKGVDVLQLLRGGPLTFPIKAVDGQPGLFILGVGDGAVRLAGDPVLGAENRHELDFGRLAKLINRPVSLPVDAGMIGDKSHAPAAKGSKVISLQY